MTGIRVIGFTGPIGSGKSLAASMVPGAVVVGFADPIYRMVSTMTGIPVEDFRRRETKEAVIPWLGRSPRELLQTLGTDWARDRVADDVWIRLWRRRIEELAYMGVETFAVPDVRFDNEAAAIRELGGEVWKIVRTGFAIGTPAHRSEHGLSPWLVSRLLVNAGTADDLRAMVENFAGRVPCSTAPS
jgi:hypothetical protein